MPVVLAPEASPAWLGEEPADPRELKALLALPLWRDDLLAREHPSGERQEQ